MKQFLSFLSLCFLSIGAQADPNPSNGQAFSLVRSEKVLFGEKVGHAVDYLLSREGNDTREIVQYYHDVELYLACEGKTDVSPEKIKMLSRNAYASSIEIYLTEPGVNVKEVEYLIAMAGKEREYESLCRKYELGAPIDQNYLMRMEAEILGTNEESFAFLLYDRFGIVLAYEEGGLSAVVEHGILTSLFGYRTHPVTKIPNTFHNGIDIAVPWGTPVKAPFSGVVDRVFTSDKGGVTIVIENSCWPLEVHFLHLSTSLVRVGQMVEAGEVIAKSGMSGEWTTGACIHVGTKWQGRWINPLLVFGNNINQEKQKPFNCSVKDNKLHIGKGS